MSGRRKHHDDPVVEITSAPPSPGEEIAHRERNYLISMGVRTVCFVGGVVAISTGVVWLGVVLFVASLILPLFAVIVGNSVSPRIEGTPTDPGFQHRELGPGDEERDG